MEYFEKVEDRPKTDLGWNIPETKKGKMSLVGGNGQNFRVEIKTAEYLTGKYPVEELMVVLPDALKGKLPELPNFLFLGATESGSFAGDEELERALGTADFNLVMGDLSKNAITGKAVTEALGKVEKPTLVTRDTVDLVAENGPEKVLMNEQVMYLASMPQLQKMFRAVYYPKMLLLSQSLVQVVDALHKFTLSYPAKIVTLHNEQILVAENGDVKAVPLVKSGYLPMMIWQGELAAKIAVLNLYNPNNFMNATICAVFA